MGKIEPERLRFTCAVLSLSFALAACAERSGPPAPVVDRTGIYYTKPAPDLPPVTAAPSATVQRAAPATTPTARRSVVTAEPLAPPPTAKSARPAVAKPKTAPRATAAADPGFPAKGSLIENKGGVVKVQRGETLYAISRRERIPLRALIEANRLKPPYALRTGQRLKLPAVRVYIVAPGDTVSAVARRFDAGISDVIRENDLKAPDFGLFSGQRLVLPWQGGKGGQSPATAVARRAPDSVSVASRVPVAALPRPEIRDPAAPPPKRAGRKFLWPVRGKVVSGFGSKGGGLYNDGINISARNGDFVRAAENGIVAYSGNELRGYGNLLLVRHSDGWVSAYAHNGALLVRRGQVVKRGQPIAKVGASGAVAKPQLHFELRRGRKAVDPRPYMS